MAPVFGTSPEVGVKSWGNTPTFGGVVLQSAVCGWCLQKVGAKMAINALTCSWRFRWGRGDRDEAFVLSPSASVPANSVTAPSRSCPLRPVRTRLIPCVRSRLRTGNPCFAVPFCRLGCLVRQTPSFPYQNGVFVCASLYTKKRLTIQSTSFSGSGERTRTSGLRVMSPTSYQLLYPAMLSAKVRRIFLKSKFSYRTLPGSTWLYRPPPDSA